MRILKKLVCKKVKGDDPLEHDDTWTDTSWEDAAEAELLRDDVYAVMEKEMLREDVYAVMEKEMGDLDIPPQWIIDYKILGLNEKGVAISEDDASDQYIVEEVRKSLKPSKKERVKKQRSKVSKSPSSQEDSKRDEPELADQTAYQVANRMVCNIMMAELEEMMAEHVKVFVKPKSLLRIKSLNTSANGKKTHFAPELEERLTVPYTLSSRKKQEVIKSPSSHRYYSTRSPSFDSDAKSIAEVSVDRSWVENSSVTSYYDDQSIETMELCFNHLTCSAQDRLVGRDWIS
jgi:hypothetical protein